MDDHESTGEDDAVATATPYEVPAVEARRSARDPLVWTATSPPLCV